MVIILSFREFWKAAPAPTIPHPPPGQGTSIDDPHPCPVTFRDVPAKAKELLKQYEKQEKKLKQKELKAGGKSTEAGGEHWLFLGGDLLGRRRRPWTCLPLRASRPRLGCLLRLDPLQENKLRKP